MFGQSQNKRMQQATVALTLVALTSPFGMAAVEAGRQGPPPSQRGHQDQRVRNDQQQHDDRRNERLEERKREEHQRAERQREERRREEQRRAENRQRDRDHERLGYPRVVEDRYAQKTVEERAFERRERRRGHDGHVRDHGRYHRGVFDAEDCGVGLFLIITAETLPYSYTVYGNANDFRVFVRDTWSDNREIEAFWGVSVVDGESVAEFLCNDGHFEYYSAADLDVKGDRLAGRWADGGRRSDRLFLDQVERAATVMRGHDVHYGKMSAPSYPQRGPSYDERLHMLDL